jgi:hypothetical protein
MEGGRPHRGPPLSPAVLLPQLTSKWNRTKKFSERMQTRNALTRYSTGGKFSIVGPARPHQRTEETSC